MAHPDIGKWVEVICPKDHPITGQMIAEPRGRIAAVTQSAHTEEYENGVANIAGVVVRMEDGCHITAMWEEVRILQPERAPVTEAKITR